MALDSWEAIASSMASMSREIVALNEKLAQPTGADVEKRAESMSMSMSSSSESSMSMPMSSSTSMSMSMPTSSSTSMSMSSSMSSMSSSMPMSSSMSMSMSMPMSTSTSTSTSSTHDHSTHDHSGMSGMTGMTGMDMTGDGSCVMQMSWNWATIDSCFLAESWHVKTSGQFAGTCIGVALWGMIIVGLAVVRRHFDAYIVSNGLRRAKRAHQRRDAPAPNAPGQCAPLGEDCARVDGLECDAKSAGADKEMSTNYVKSSTQSLRSAASLPANFTENRGVIGNWFGGRGLITADGMAVRPNFLEQIVRALMYGFQYSITSLLALILMSFNGYVIISAFLGVSLGFLFLDWPTFRSRNPSTEEHESARPICC